MEKFRNVHPRINSYQVGEGLFHPPKIVCSPDENQDRDERGDGDHRPRTGLRAEQCPTESFDHTDHRIQAVNSPPRFGQELARVSDWRSEKPELNNEWDDIPDITEFHVE